jgi:hypothetical protein
VRGLIVRARFVPCSPNLVTLLAEALSSSETSFLTRATRRNVPEDTILLYSDILLFIRINITYVKFHVVFTGLHSEPR